MLDVALQRTTVKAQWLPMVQAFDSWLEFDDTVQPWPTADSLRCGDCDPSQLIPYRWLACWTM